jgi:hypothetical protein
VTSFSNTFTNCTNLEVIPGSLFTNNTKVRDFNQVFYGCASLATIPSGLFDNNKAVTTFRNVFCNCTGLDGDLPEWWNDASYPSSTHPQFHLDLTATPDVLRMFRGCTNATNYGAVDPNWK